MKCKNCGKKVSYDQEFDLIHPYLDNKGRDPRLCNPYNPDSKIAERAEDTCWGI